jgi:hypothetical protein
MVLRAGLEPGSVVPFLASVFTSRYLTASCETMNRKGDAGKCGKMSGIWQIIGKFQGLHSHYSERTFFG